MKTHPAVDTKAGARKSVPVECIKPSGVHDIILQSELPMWKVWI